MVKLDYHRTSSAFYSSDRFGPTPLARTLTLTFVCYLVAIRPCKEGRFHKKEYVFDKTDRNGQTVFSSNKNHGILIHVTELMNETEY